MVAKFITLKELFQASADRFPEQIAVKDKNGEISYQQLMLRSSRLADKLASRGVMQGDAVILYLERSVDSLIALNAIMLLGGVVVPLSADIPILRLKYIVSDANAKAVICELAQLDAVSDQLNETCCLSAQADELGEVSTTSRVVEVMRQDLAYIIYTSGTTGQPKGVMTSHEAIVRRYYDWQELYRLDEKPLNILQMAKAGFDVFIGDIVKSMGSGGKLVICPDMAILDPAQLYHWISDDKIDYVDMVPAVLRVLVAYLQESGQSLKSLAMLNCGADLWTKEEYLQFKEVLKVGRLLNSYGVTECSVESTIFEDTDNILSLKQTLPIGTALPSDEILVLNDLDVPVEVGVVGQLCLGGPCLSKGYVNLDELTQKTFIQLEGEQGKVGRYYKTGDLVSMDENGVLEFFGRMDTQVKINGNRVELHEIERVLEQRADVKKAVVLFEQKTVSLHGFVLLQDGVTFEPSQLMGYLGAKLPAYMRLRSILPVKEFALNQNNKIDRKVLQNKISSMEKISTKARKKQPNELYKSKTLEQLATMLADRGINIPALVSEFIKPNANRAILVTGSLEEQTASPVSDLDLLILLDSAKAFKKPKHEIFGNRVNHLPSPSTEERVFSMFISGLEVECHFIVNEMLRSGSGGDIVQARRSDLASHNKFLSRLNSTWVVHDDGLLSMWRECYELQHIRIRRVSQDFIAAAKNLEDMQAAIGVEKAHVGVMGIYIVSQLLRAMLGYHNYFSKSAKWMKKVNRILSSCPDNVSHLLNNGQSLMFPDFHESVEQEQKYFNEVYQYCTDVRVFLSQDEALGELLDMMIVDLDIIL